ncbi:MAG: hypothetical protein ACEQSA_03090 [Weeksellaceae bacterium]
MSKFLIALDILLAALLAWRYNSLPQQIPLYYSRPWGEQQIADTWHLALLPVLMHIMFFANILIAKRFFAHHELFQKIFKLANILTIIAYTALIIQIMFLVT